MICRSTTLFILASSLMLLMYPTNALLNCIPGIDVKSNKSSCRIGTSSSGRTLTTSSLFVASDKSDQDFMNDFQSAAIETTRKSLEESNLQRRLKSRPVKLPYDVARKWVQANLGVDTKEEFEDFVANGKLRTPYIPKRPEEYYKRTREWISWDHFLLGMFDKNNPSRVAPATGMFD